MGDFDFGQFQQVYEYLTEKLKEGGSLTPEEQKVYDMLLGFAGQGLNLTKTGDFQSLYNAFNALADEGTKKEFEKLYGTNFTQGKDGKIQFTRPGSVIEAFQRRGLSVNDGPAMAALSEGLTGYLDAIARNKFAAMTNSYAAMTPIRAQNIQAATNAGNIASTAIGRRVPIAGTAGGAGSAGGGEGSGEPITIETGKGGADKPDFFDKYGAALLSLLGTGVLGVGGYLGKKWWEDREKNKSLEASKKEDLDPDAEERAPDYHADPYGLNTFQPRADTSALDMGFGESPLQNFQNNPNSIFEAYQQPQFQSPQQQWAPQESSMGGSSQDFYSGPPDNPYAGWSTWNPENNQTPQYGGDGWSTMGDSNAWSPSSWGDPSGGYWV
jgi:hypothetical protein